MNIETTISKNIRTAGNNADYDAACKRLLSEKVILAWIMKNCLEEYQNCGITEIVDNILKGNHRLQKYLSHRMKQMLQKAP